MDVKKVARLANLPLTDEEEKKYGQQLEKVLYYVNQLQQVDTAGVSETSQVTGTKNVSRDDVETACPKLVEDYIKVPAIFGND